MSNQIHVIAEAGTNHNGKLDLAKKLVDAAVIVGADSVKFQIIYPEGLYLPKFYQQGSYVDNDVFHKRAANTLSDQDYEQIADYCQCKAIPFSASVFDHRGIDLLDRLNAPYIKIASCDLNNSRLLIDAAERKRKVIISTGMASLGEIEQAVTDITTTGNNDIVIMHCVSVYPCTTERMNLHFIETLKCSFGFPVGLSDHTENSIASVIAVSMGVQWIEKHFTLDRTSEGFDHAYAMEPHGLELFIQDVKSAALACQPNLTKLGQIETTTKQRARRSIYAGHDIPQEHIITESDLIVVRPEGPLAPNDIHLVIGQKTNRMIRQYEAISLKDLE